MTDRKFPESQGLREGPYTYDLRGGEAVLTGYDGTEEELTVPAELGGCPVTEIGPLAFAHEEPYFPNESAELRYRRCRPLELTKLRLPESVRTIGFAAFCGLKSLREVILPAHLSSMASFAFHRTGLRSVTIPGTIGCPDRTGVPGAVGGPGCVPPYAFSECASLERAVLEDGIVTVLDRAFEKCPSLRELRLPETLKTVEYCAFCLCGIERLEIPGSVEELGAHAFAGNAALTELRLNEGLRVIEFNAFLNCTALRQAELPSSLRNLGNRFRSYIPGSGRDSPNGREEDVFGGCTALEEFTVREGNGFLSAREGVLFDRSGATLLVYPKGRRAEEYRVPEGTVTIGNRAFAGNRFLRRVFLPDTLRRILYEGFCECASLEEARLPEGVEEVRARAFFGCPALPKE